MDEAYQNLAEAIVVQAVDDYRDALRIYKKNPNYKKLSASMKELEDFFMSEWFETLSGLNGEEIMNKLRKEVLSDDK